jgi:ABC-2 type transport system permease protein
MFGGIAVQKMVEKRVGPTERRIVVVDGTGVLLDDLAKAAAARNQREILDPTSGKQIRPRYLLEAGPAGAASEDVRFQLSERVRSRQIDSFVEIPAGVDRLPSGAGGPKVAFHAENAAVAEEKDWLQKALGDAVRIRRLQEAKIDPELAARAGAAVIVEPLGLVERSQAGQFTKPRESGLKETILVPFGMMMMMFMVIILTAQPMIESVLEEKSQRIAEVLLGSANAFQLMVGKLIGGVGGSLTVVATYAVGVGALAWYFDALHLVPLRIVPWFLVYQVLAVLLFGSVFMAVGAAVNQLKEAQGMLLPVWLVIVSPLFVWIQVVRDPTGSFATWLSFFPPATPLCMVLRLGASSAVPWWQPALGVVVMLAATALGVLATARIFRIGILAQGKAPSIAELLRWAIRG